jgi:hypothetical protein
MERVPVSDARAAVRFGKRIEAFRNALIRGQTDGDAIRKLFGWPQTFLCPNESTS